MSLIIHLAAQALAVPKPPHGVPPAQAPLVPDPPPSPPPGFSGPIGMIFAWIKWGAIAAGMFGMSACGLMMILGRRNRSTLAADGASGIPYVLLGLMVVSAGSAIVGAFL